MATRTIKSTGGNWSAAGTWVEGAVPTAADDVVATATSGNLVLNTTGLVCRSLDLNLYTATLSGTNGLTIGDATAGAGNVAVRLGASMTRTSTGTWTLASTSATQQTITTNGKTYPSITISGVGSSYLLADDFSAPVGATLTLSNGTLDANNRNVTVGKFVSISGATRSLVMGTGTWTMTGTSADVWNVQVAGLTFSGASATLVCADTAAGTKILDFGNGLTYGTVTIPAGGGPVALTGIAANVTITNLNVTGPKTISFQAARTWNIANWNINGTAGNLVTISSSTAGSAATLNFTGATPSSDYLSVKDVTATGQSLYAGVNSTNVSGNTNVIFGTLVVKAGGVGSTAKVGGTHVVDTSGTTVDKIGGPVGAASAGASKVAEVIKAAGVASTAALGASTRTVLVSKSSGPVGAAALGAAKTALVSKPGGLTAVSRVGTSKVVEITKTSSGPRATGIFDAVKSPIISHSGGPAATAVLGALKTPLVTKSAGLVGVGRIGATRTVVVDKANGPRGVGVFGGSKTPVTSKSAGPVAVGRPGGVRTVDVVKASGARAVGILGGSTATGGTADKDGAVRAVSSLGAIRTPVVVKAGGPVGSCALGGTRMQARAATGGVVATTALGGARLAYAYRVGGLAGAASTAAIKTLDLVRSGGILSGGITGAGLQPVAARLGGPLASASTGASRTIIVIKLGGLTGAGSLAGSGTLAFNLTGGLAGRAALGGFKGQINVPFLEVNMYAAYETVALDATYESGALDTEIEEMNVSAVLV